MAVQSQGYAGWASAPVEAARGDGRLIYGDAERTAEARVLLFARGARLLRAVRDLCLCWAGAGAVAVAIPFANLLLAPALFVAGIVMFVRELRTPVGVREVSGVCPACDVDQYFHPVSSPLRPGTRLECENCHRPIGFSLDRSTLRPETAPSA